MTDFSRLVKSNCQDAPGVYIMKNVDNKILYIGKAKSIKKRLNSYLSKKLELKTIRLLKQVASIKTIVTNSEKDALILENNLIKKHKPKYNILLKDGKTYPYLYLSNDKFPRLMINRTLNPSSVHGTLFGPYPNKYLLKQAIDELQILFNLRTCTNNSFANRSRPCLLYQINKCSGSCCSLISEQQYQGDVNSVSNLLKGKNKDLIKGFENKMQVASNNMDYEAAAIYRDKIKAFRELTKKQSIFGKNKNSDIVYVKEQEQYSVVVVIKVIAGEIFDQNISKIVHSDIISEKAHSLSIKSAIIEQLSLKDLSVLIVPDSIEEWQQSCNLDDITIKTPKTEIEKKWMAMANANAVHKLNQLSPGQPYLDGFLEMKSVFKLQKLPERIEAYDISHNKGNHTYGSKVVISAKGKEKSEYRRYAITGITAGDDLAALKQVITRRLKQPISNTVLLIDGGKNQLKSVLATLVKLNKSIFTISIVKDDHRKEGAEKVITSDLKMQKISNFNSLFRLLLLARNEAHKTAIEAHRKKRDKTYKTSILNTIPGIGDKKARLLLNEFGSVLNIKNASISDLTVLTGINDRLANIIKNYIEVNY